MPAVSSLSAKSGPIGSPCLARFMSTRPSLGTGQDFPERSGLSHARRSRRERTRDADSARWSGLWSISAPSSAEHGVPVWPRPVRLAKLLFHALQFGNVLDRPGRGDEASEFVVGVLGEIQHIADLAVRPHDAVGDAVCQGAPVAHARPKRPAPVAVIGMDDPRVVVETEVAKKRAVCGFESAG